MTETIIMPLGKTTPIRTSIREKTKARMIAYMQYAKFDDEGDFMDKCINFVCNKDKNFLKQEKSLTDKLNNGSQDS